MLDGPACRIATGSDAVAIVAQMVMDPIILLIDERIEAVATSGKSGFGSGARSPPVRSPGGITLE